jgi:exosome complex RNA-binding protein Rrp4
MTNYLITLIDWKNGAVIESTVRNAPSEQDAVLGLLEKVPAMDYSILIRSEYVN